jgi:hypothetical protein
MGRLDIPKFPELIRKMSDAELVRNGKAAAYIAKLSRRVWACASDMDTAT